MTSFELFAWITGGVLIVFAILMFAGGQRYVDFENRAFSSMRPDRALSNWGGRIRFAKWLCLVAGAALLLVALVLRLG